MGKPVNRDELKLSDLVWLALAVLLAGIPHWQRLPVWIPVTHLGLLLLRVGVPYRFPRFWSEQETVIGVFKLLVVAVVTSGAYLTYGSLAGRDVGTAMLVLLASLKFFESRCRQDFYTTAWLGYFIVITGFFYSQTMLIAAYMLFVVMVMTTCLVGFNDTGQRLSLTAKSKLAGLLLLQSIPVLLILFFLFPRINGPLWGLPEDAHTGITGIDDQMAPGTISRLIYSDEVAFRVNFTDEIPEQSKLYWRGPVLSKTNGYSWTSGESRRRLMLKPIRYNGEAIRYDVIQEPTNKRWLFGLEMVEKPVDRSYFTGDYQLKSDDLIHARKAFSLTSYSDYHFGINSVRELERELVLPEASHPRARAFGSELRDQYQSPGEIVAAVLEWFGKKNFIYTLTPPLIRGDKVDNFLFGTRSGFCEHYAAAFTVLMRAAGIPARVVTGYLGGEVNPLGNYLIVRQYHAHAWAEIWLEEQGWVRVDPTSVISSRVSEGIESAIPETAIGIPLNLERNALAIKLWQRLRNTVDVLNYQWAQWVLGYDPGRQQRLLQKIGFDNIDWRTLTTLMMILLAIVMAGIAFFVFTKTVKPIDPAKLHYDIFCKKMAKIGFPRAPFEGPDTYAGRIALVRRDLGQDIRHITDLYVSVRYRSNRTEMERLKENIKSFSPGQT